MERLLRRVILLLAPFNAFVPVGLDELAHLVGVIAVGYVDVALIQPVF